MKVATNGVELETETFGDPSHPALLLIMGLGCQMLVWPRAFCEQLASAGFYVVRFDNRDVGLSTQLDTLGTPKLMREILRQRIGLRPRACQIEGECHIADQMLDRWPGDGARAGREAILPESGDGSMRWHDDKIPLAQRQR